MLLTIAIPTFNRNDVLHDNLRLLLPQMTVDCRLLILDNHSDVPVADTLAGLIAEHPAACVEIVRNRVNLGASGNILRCFERCESEWIWTLGDDDAVAPDAVANILKRLEAQPDCVFFHFGSVNYPRSETLITNGAHGLIQGMDCYSNMLFMSVGVYHAPTILPNLRFGYLSAYAWAPHFAMLLTSLGETGRCCLCHESIIEACKLVSSELYWSPISEMLGRMTLLDLPLNLATRKELAEWLPEKPAIEYIVSHLVLTALKENDTRQALYLYDQICSRLYYFDRRLSRRVRIAGYRPLIQFPRSGKVILAILFDALERTGRSTNRKLSDIVVQNRFERA